MFIVKLILLFIIIIICYLLLLLFKQFIIYTPYTYAVN